MMPSAEKDDRLLTIEELVAATRKEHGEHAIQVGRYAPPIPRLQTGSLSLDLMLGGGLPAGCWTEIIGDESAGKTTVVCKMIAKNQAITPSFTTLWIAAEPFVEDWAEIAGCDLDRIYRLPLQEMEAAYDEAKAYMRNRAVDLVVIDSLPSLTPTGEYESEFDKSLPALAARLNNKFFRVAGAAMARPLSTGDRLCTGIIVNQWRERIGVTHGDPRTTPGGKGKNFAYFVRMEVRRHEWLQATRTSPRIGLSIAARTIKNKSAPPQRTALVDFYFDGGSGIPAGSYDVAKDLMLSAMELGIITRGGSRYSFNDQRWTGKDPVLSSLREDLDLQEQVYAETIAAVGPVTVPGAKKFRLVGR